MSEPANWSDFFVASMGAAAALSGLVAVAISINLKHILKFKHLPAAPARRC
jgi:modulator of FtsH protease